MFNLNYYDKILEFKNIIMCNHFQLNLHVERCSKHAIMLKEKFVK
jgi:hypothetical protein